MATQKERRATPRKPAAQPQPIAKTTTPENTSDEVRRRIEMTAYFKAKARGFAPGYELEDWLAAEREVKQHRQP